MTMMRPRWSPISGRKCLVFSWLNDLCIDIYVWLDVKVWMMTDGYNTFDRK